MKGLFAAIEDPKDQETAEAMLTSLFAAMALHGLLANASALDDPVARAWAIADQMIEFAKARELAARSPTAEPTGGAS